MLALQLLLRPGEALCDWWDVQRQDLTTATATTTTTAATATATTTTATTTTATTAAAAAAAADNNDNNNINGSVALHALTGNNNNIYMCIFFAIFTNETHYYAFLNKPTVWSVGCSAL